MGYWGQLCDLSLWPQPWTWPWFYKVKVWNSIILGIGGQIEMEFNIPALLQIMACRLAGAKSLSEPMLEDWTKWMWVDHVGIGGCFYFVLGGWMHQIMNFGCWCAINTSWLSVICLIVWSYISHNMVVSAIWLQLYCDQFIKIYHIQNHIFGGKYYELMIQRIRIRENLNCDFPSSSLADV